MNLDRDTIMRSIYDGKYDKQVLIIELLLEIAIMLKTQEDRSKEGGKMTTPEQHTISFISGKETAEKLNNLLQFLQSLSKNQIVREIIIAPKEYVTFKPSQRLDHVCVAIWDEIYFELEEK